MLECPKCKSELKKEEHRYRCVNQHLSLIHILSAQTAGYGSSQIIEIRSKIVHPCFVDQKEDILIEWLEFLKEILFSPLLSQEAFEESKHILLSKIERMMDDPAQYVINECLKLAGKNTSLGISALGLSLIHI